MTGLELKSRLSKLRVRDAMRMLVAGIERDATIEKAIRFSVKFKVNAVLVTDEHHNALGVVSKTNLMAAYYAGFPIDTPLHTIMVGPALFCHVNDTLESALDLMCAKRVMRLYVSEDAPNRAVGVLAYPDMVGLLYRYCRQCERSIVRSKYEPESDPADIFLVREVMRPSVQCNREDETLLQVMESLSEHHLGAVLIRAESGEPVGVLSKTDLMLAYKHGVPAEATARSVMSSPVRVCGFNEPLVMAIQRMIFSDVHRLFVCKNTSDNIVGVLSLADAARVRSGSCRACISSRLTPDQ